MTTMLDAVRTALEVTHESLKGYENRTNNPPKKKTNTPWSYWNEQKDSFRAWLAETTLKPYIEVKVKEQEEKALKEKAKAEQETKMNLELSLARCQNLIKYFEEVERALIDCDAKTWAEVNPAEAAAQETLKTHVVTPQTHATLPPSATQSATDSEEFLAKHYKASYVPLSFIIFREQWEREELAPAHTIPLYEELFEACWTGNNERITELCLPPKTGKRNNDTEYLQITCEVRFNPSIPAPPCLNDNVGAEISSFKEYPREAQTVVCRSISRLSGQFFLTLWKALLLCALLSFLGTGKPQRSSLPLQQLNTRHLLAQLHTTIAVVSYSRVSQFIFHFVSQNVVMRSTMRTRI